MSRFIILIMAAVLVVTGCGKKASEKLAEKILEKSMAKDGIKADVKISGDKVSINAVDQEGRKITVKNTGENVTFEGENEKTVFTAGPSAKLPADFPKDVHIYKGATIASSMTTPEGFALVLQSKDQVSKIVETYKAEMTSSGWGEESSFVTPQQTVLVYKKSNRTTSVMMMGSEESVQIIISIATDEE